MANNPNQNQGKQDQSKQDHSKQGHQEGQQEQAGQSGNSNHFSTKGGGLESAGTHPSRRARIQRPKPATPRSRSYQRQVAPIIGPLKFIDWIAEPDFML